MSGAEVPCCEIAEKPVSGKGGKPTVSNGEMKADVPEKREKKEETQGGRYAYCSYFQAGRIHIAGFQSIADNNGTQQACHTQGGGNATE